MPRRCPTSGRSWKTRDRRGSTSKNAWRVRWTWRTWRRR